MRVPLGVPALAAALLLAGCRGVPRAPAAPTARFDAPLPASFAVPAEVVIYGDTRRRLGVEVWREDATCARRAVAAAIARERPALVVHTGDLVAAGDDPCDWALFDEETAAIRAAGIPFVPVAGNHEYVGEEGAARRLYLERFPALKDPLRDEIRVGGLVLLAIDTNAGDLPRGEADRTVAWLAERLAAAERDASARWVVIVGHHPPMTNAVWHKPDPWVAREVLAPALAFPKFSAYVAGHVHAYERFEVGGRHVIVAGGGGAPRVDVLRDHRAHDLYPGGATRPFHYLRVTVGEDRCAVEAVMLDECTGAFAVGDRVDLGPGGERGACGPARRPGIPPAPATGNPP